MKCNTGRAKEVLRPGKRSRTARKQQKTDEDSNVDDRSKNYSDHYLMKNEPDDFSVDDLAKEPQQLTCWGEALAFANNGSFSCFRTFWGLIRCGTDVTMSLGGCWYAERVRFNSL
jgi:hypothetical protein